MSSPFPGMDPYLEYSAGDVHACASVRARDTIQPLLPDELVARIQTTRIPWRDRPRWESEPYHRVVIAELQSPESPLTIIEFAKNLTVRKQAERESIAHDRLAIGLAARSFVWVNLVRSNDELLLSEPLPELVGRSGYWLYTNSAAVRAATSVNRTVRVASIPLRETLPVIHIPLRPDDAPVPLDLQLVADHVYATGRYDLTIDYRRDANPPLNGEDAFWADELLKAAGKR